MAKLGNIEIANKSSNFDCGAAFLLSEKECPESKIVIVEPESEVEVQQTNPYVVIRSKGLNNPDSLAEELYEVAQRGLDLLCISGIANLSIHRASDEHLIWWRESSQQILRVVCVYKVKSGASSISSDSLHPQKYHESLRYFRLSQITDDLSDAYRNMYLALELLVTSISPKRSNESELVWLKRVLKDEANNISGFPAVDEEIIRKIYRDVRCRLFHAKENYILPQSYDSSERKNITRILRELTTIVLSLAENHLNLSRSGGVLPLSAFKSTIEWMKLQSEMIISDMKTTARYAPEFSNACREAVFGQVGLTDLERCGNLSEFVFQSSSTNTALPVNLALEITAEFIDQLQVVAGLEFINSDGPKYFFKT
ncbi:hypothetical protein JOY44_18855 [Phormidium sp. CLA17]|uniref:hypothetical protein n=1 Tax=Leptolyngbya sp. Cla-17 TaxID=2803751 RepID=UPI001490CD7B|nr:hypothetical protein [Leptolyngbya sp. Cla-17]MBM0743650.1 hypothetical protein [Leptolyngbya sp. Cla-17]